jgi:hypothetical protein
MLHSRFDCASIRLLPLFLSLVSVAACSALPPLDPEQIARVEQNFDKIQPGMTQEQVRKLVGEPLESRIARTMDNKWSAQLCGQPKPSCEVDLWLLEADPEDYMDWPHVSFDPKTGRVIRSFKEEQDKYFEIGAWF